jgi:hypothetical protein
MPSFATWLFFYYIWVLCCLLLTVDMCRCCENVTCCRVNARHNHHSIATSFLSSPLCTQKSSPMSTVDMCIHFVFAFPQSKLVMVCIHLAFAVAEV